MTVSKDFIEYVLELLEPIGDIKVTRMFGGALMKTGGKQLGVLIDETLYFKVINPNLQEKYKSNGSRQFTYTRKDKKDPVVIKNWWSVPDGAMDNGEELVRLAEEVLNQSG